MDRLTNETQLGPFASLKDKAEARPGAFRDYDCWYAHMVAVTSLKAYEDTGLSPADIADLTARAEKAEKERDELKALCRPVCPECGLENDRHFQGILCDRCGADIRGAQEAGKGEAPNE